LGIAALTMVVRLNDPPGGYRQPGDPVEYVHDECYQAFTAHRYAIGDRDAWNPFATRESAAKIDSADMTHWTTYEWVHPPTAKLIMSWFVRLFGFQPTAYRLGSVIFGVLVLLATWRLALFIAGPEYAFFTILLLASDGMVFVLSRVAMNDIYVTACTTFAMLCIYLWWTRPRESGWGWLLGAGLSFGVGLTMKWSAGPIAFGMAIIVAARIAWLAIWGDAPPQPPAEAPSEAEKSGRKGKRKPPPGTRARVLERMERRKKPEEQRKRLEGRTLLLTLAAFVGGWFLAPPILYLASYIPYFVLDYTWDDFEKLNHQIWWYHHALKATHSMSSRWWEWPLVTRPVWFYAHRFPGTIRVIYAMGNPILWWAFLPSLAWIVVRWFRKRDPADGLILCGFFGFWLPWVFVDRVAFIQYLLPAVPFGTLAVARALGDLGAALKRPHAVIGAYAAIVVLMFVNFYPFWTGYPIPNDVIAGKRYYWFEKWRQP
jgi:dolichyl-phosphate-mannose--protein O-mannosyl transferase